MSLVAVAVIGAVGAAVTAGATIYGANQQAQATNNASKTQAEAAQAGINEQKRQFDQIQQLLAPYVQTGNKALSSQADLAGLNGQAAQQAAIQGIQNGPEYSALMQSGSNSILQNAAATGGLRGGNTQAALGQYGIGTLSNLINQQYNQLGGLSSLGQASAAGQAAAGQANANQISNLLGQQGAATAAGQLASGVQAQQYAGAIGNLAGTLGGLNWGGTNYSSGYDNLATQQAQAAANYGY